MANDFYNADTLLDRNVLGRANQVNAIFQSIAAGFDKIPGEIALNQGAVTYYVDSGSANAYAVTFDPAVTSYVAGLSINVKIGNTNTAASTINVNALGVKPIKRFNGDDVVAGDLTAGAIVPMTYDGTNFILTGVHGGLVASTGANAAAAAASATSASNSATAASGSAATASAASTAAGNAQSAAEAAQSAAETAQSGAETAEANAAASETAAALSETAAAASETAAAESETAAAASESAAATSASNAATSESNAATSEFNAAASEAAAAASYDSFDDRYLGPKASDPTLDNDGDALLTGALYFNTALTAMKFYDGSSWLTAYNPSLGIDDQADAVSITIDASENVGIKNDSPSEALDVTGNILASGDVTAASDERLKINIETISGALDSVLAMRGVSFTRLQDKTRSSGVIAQELQVVAPELVKAHDNGYLSVAYGNIVGYLIEAIKEQQRQIDALSGKK